MSYRIKKAIHTNVKPSLEGFDGLLLHEGDARSNYVLFGKGILIDEEEAASYGLIGTEWIESCTPEQVKAERIARNAGTHSGGAGLAISQAPAPSPPARQVSDEASPDAVERVQAVIAESQAIRAEETTASKAKAEALARPYNPQKVKSIETFSVDEAVMPELVEHFKTLKQAGGVHPNRIINTLKKHGWKDNITASNKDEAKTALTSYAASKR